ncbi:MAG: RNA polymerase sigma factor [Chloroflexi bacterium]|nr:RNA polymerase sigma factor [Chloroflexota bacterium]
MTTKDADVTTKDAPAFAVFEPVTAVLATSQLHEALSSHGPVLLAAARGIVRNEAEAQDLVQTTFEIAVRQIHQLRDPGALRAWLLTIETREAFRLSRRLRRLSTLDGRVSVTAMAGPSTDDTAVRIALGHLPARIRAAVVLHHLSGLSVEETAAALGTRPNTVKTQLRDGLQRMRRELRDG